MTRVLRLVLLGAVGLMRRAIDAAVVTSPSEIWTVVAGRPYTIEWEMAATGAEAQAGTQHVDADLFYCDKENECSQWVANLCTDEDVDCTSTSGALEVLMPEPIYGTSWGYRVLVSDASAAKSFASYSDEFRLMVSHEAALAPFVAVNSPAKGDLAVAGEDYTVEFAYDYGISSKTDRLWIDLYMSGRGLGDCGVWVGSLCDEPDVGCKGVVDGVYDITIPAPTNPGFYSIRVGRAGDDLLFNCSDEFEVVAPSAKPINK